MGLRFSVGLRPARPDLDALRRAALTYPEHGATRGALPAGFRHVRRRAPLGAGRAAFDEAVRSLSGWGMHHGAGLGVTASSPVAAPGTVVVLTVGWRRLGVLAPCRVVYTVDEPNRRGFAYGTLPGHPESGEEAFVVELTGTNEVYLEITAFSRPAGLLARLGDPVGRRVQALITNRYVTALRRG